VECIDDYLIDFVGPYRRIDSESRSDRSRPRCLCSSAELPWPNAIPICVSCEPWYEDNRIFFL
jgi:hypothetical protein